MWLLTWQEDGDVDKAKAQLLEQTINICAGRLTSEEILSHPQYKTLSNITNQLCHQLGPFQYGKVIFTCTWSRYSQVLQKFNRSIKYIKFTSTGDFVTHTYTYNLSSSIKNFKYPRIKEETTTYIIAIESLIIFSYVHSCKLKIVLIQR